MRNIVYIENIPQIKLKWSIYKGASLCMEDFSRAEVKLWLVNRLNKILLDGVVGEDGSLMASIPSHLPAAVYGVSAIWLKDDKDMYGEKNAVAKVMRSDVSQVLVVSSDAAGTRDDDFTICVKSDTASYGYDGLSAYEMAVLKGKTSLSEEEWIEAQSGAATMYGSLQSQINEIIAGGAEPQVSVSPSVVLVGQSSLAVKGTVKKNATSLTLYKGASASGEAVASGSGTSVSGTSTINETSNGVVYFSLKAVINGVAVTTTGQVKVEMPVYAGFGATIADVAGVTSKKLSARSSANGTYTATASANGQKYFIVVPNYMSKLSNFSMGGTPFVMANGATTIDGVSYNYYVSGSAYNSGTKLTITAS